MPIDKRLINFEIDKNGCFICISHKQDAHGYPRVKIRGIQYKIHRFVYQECFGDIPNGMVIRHTCDNRLCINPEHLLIGTNYDNVKDMTKRGRNAKGERNGNSVLNTDQVKQIKSMIGIKSNAKIAKIFNVGVTTIANIRIGKTWRHVDN